MISLGFGAARLISLQTEDIPPTIHAADEQHFLNLDTLVDGECPECGHDCPLARLLLGIQADPDRVRIPAITAEPIEGSAMRRGIEGFQASYQGRPVLQNLVLQLDGDRQFNTLRILAEPACTYAYITEVVDDGRYHCTACGTLARACHHEWSAMRRGVETTVLGALAQQIDNGEAANDGSVVWVQHPHVGGLTLALTDGPGPETWTLTLDHIPDPPWSTIPVLRAVVGTTASGNCQVHRGRSRLCPEAELAALMVAARDTAEAA